ncbi:MAG: radical SAM protein, partial [Candidatus Woesearchaeota archaeon]
DGDLKFISLEHFKFIVKRKMRLKNFRNFLIDGGEPLIHPQIFAFLRFLQKNEIRPVIRTNARMLANLDFCKKIGDYSDHILVVDPADDEEKYEKITKVKGSWNQSRRGIRNWRTLGKKVVHFKP